MHPSGQYTATASSTFTVSAGGEAGGGTVTNAFDGDGNVTSRTWSGGLTQTLSWDAFGRLIKVSQRDSSNNGYDWTAAYDGLGRRLKTTQQPVAAGNPGGAATVTTSIYDPQVEFLEIGVAVAGAKAWKVFGPDANGRFGLLQGTGGLEAVILDASGTMTGVINDQFGNGVATVSGGSVTWNTTRVGAYGPLPGIVPQTLGDVTQLAAATAWRGHRIDPTGFYYLGARYYEPTSGRFLSADPMGHAVSPSLYDYASGDPVNGMDPDGRCAGKSTDWPADQRRDIYRRIAQDAFRDLEADGNQDDVLTSILALNPTIVVQRGIHERRVDNATGAVVERDLLGNGAYYDFGTNQLVLTVGDATDTSGTFESQIVHEGIHGRDKLGGMDLNANRIDTEVNAWERTILYQEAHGGVWDWLKPLVNPDGSVNLARLRRSLQKDPSYGQRSNYSTTTTPIAPETFPLSDIYHPNPK